MTSTFQLELPLLSLSKSAKTRPEHLDFPLKPLPAVTMDELTRLATRWGRSQTRRSLRLHGLR